MGDGHQNFTGCPNQSSDINTEGKHSLDGPNLKARRADMSALKNYINWSPRRGAKKSQEQRSTLERQTLTTSEKAHPVTDPLINLGRSDGIVHRRIASCPVPFPSSSNRYAALADLPQQ